MSLYVEWLNKIKALSTNAWLTDAQRDAYDQILSKWQSQSFVSLIGPSGCGKTFIAHLLAREHKYIYAHDIQSASEGAAELIIDGEEYSRLMRDVARLRGIQRVIVLSRKALKDQMPQAKVIITPKDLKQFQHNLIEHHILQSFMSTSETTDFAQILREESIMRGK